MRLVRVGELETGAVLGRDVLVGRNGRVPLLRHGATLERRYIGRLEETGIRSVYVDDELGEGIEVTPLLSEETRSFVADALEAVFERAGSGRNGTRELSGETLSQMASLVQRLALEVADCPDATGALQDLAAADAYTLQHSIDVTALGLLLGERCFRARGWSEPSTQRRFDGMDDRLVQLGLGLMLHDIGKLSIPPAILNKPGPLDEEEWELVRTHPLTGLELLSPTTTGALVRAVVRSHHERWDGSGYPDGKSGTEIHQHARIAAIADVYDAVTSERVYSRARSPQEGWRLIVDGAGRRSTPSSSPSSGASSPLPARFEDRPRRRVIGRRRLDARRGARTAPRARRLGPARQPGRTLRARPRAAPRSSADRLNPRPAPAAPPGKKEHRAGGAFIRRLH